MDESPDDAELTKRVREGDRTAERRVPRHRSRPWPWVWVGSQRWN